MKLRIDLRLHRIDGWLVTLLALLAILGLLVLYSAAEKSVDMLVRQGGRLAIGVCAMIVLAQTPVDWLRRAAPWFYLVGLAMLVAVLFFGVSSKGAQRWLDIGFRFQPSEIMKVAVPMVMAWYLASRPLPPSLMHLLVATVFTLLPFVLILKQPDLGTSLLVVASGGFVLFLAGMYWWLIALILAAAAAAAPLFWNFVMKEYQRQRVLTFLDPTSDPLGSGWNIIQSKTAIGSGGVYGKGWLEGTQAHLNFLPEGHTDFIFAVMAEEFGLVGCLFIMMVYLLVVVRGLTISALSPSPFGRLLAGSLTLTFFVYVFINIGMVSGLLPVVGLPLPLISYGGTSLVTIMAGFGMLSAIHAERNAVE